MSQEIEGQRPNESENAFNPTELTARALRTHEQLSSSDMGYLDAFTPAYRFVHALTKALGAGQISQEEFEHALIVEIAVNKSKSNVDNLGLPNEDAFKTRLQEAVELSRRLGTSLCVAYVDLDGFKKINDEFGHNVGDEFIVETKRHLGGSLRQSDFVARLHGDEFAVLLQGTTVNEALIPLERLRLSAGLLIPGRVAGKKGNENMTEQLKRAKIGFSIGVVGADYRNKQYTSPAELLRSADLATIAAKKFSRDRIVVSNPDSTLTDIKSGRQYTATSTVGTRGKVTHVFNRIGG